MRDERDMSSEEFQAYMNNKALKVGKALDGIRFDNVVTLLTGMLAEALRQGYPDVNKRDEIFWTLMVFLRQRAELPEHTEH